MVELKGTIYSNSPLRFGDVYFVSFKIMGVVVGGGRGVAGIWIIEVALKNGLGVPCLLYGILKCLPNNEMYKFSFTVIINLVQSAYLLILITIGKTFRLKR